MKPNFALSLSVEGIRLLHRSAGGWHSIGDVSFDADDIPAELAMLRKTAAALEPGGVRTKLLIPNDQIKFMTLETPGLSDAARISEARRALEGATPYAVDDLAFDISSDGAQTHIAAVARETLAEAEAFATAHRFHPVSFVAQPDDAVFRGEPFFGPTKASETLLDQGDAVEPDEDAVVVRGPDVPPLEDTPVQEPEADQSQDDLKQEDGADAEAAEPPPLTQAEAEQPAPELAKAAAVSKTPEPPALVYPSAEPAAFSSRRKATVPSAGTATRGPTNTPVPSVSMPVAAEKTAALQATPPITAPGLVPDSRSLSTTPDEKPKTKKLGFLARRTQPQPPTAAAFRDTANAPSAPASEAEKMTIFGARKSNGVGGKPRFLGLLLTAALLVFLAGVAAWASVFLDDGVSLSRLFSSRDTTAVASAPVETSDPEPGAAVEGTDDPTALAASLATPAPLGEERVAFLDPSLTDEDGAVLDALRVPELAQPRVLSQQEIEAKYATSGIWALAPDTPTAPAMVTLDDLYMTSIDPVSTANDAVALPALASFGGDEFDFSPSSPAPSGTTFALDNSGMVIPTPDGALNADGVKVIAGRPPVEPPQAVTRSAQAPEPVDDAPQSQALLRLRPVERPNGLVESNERSNLGGLTRSELASRRPTLRPISVQEAAAAALEPTAPEAVAAASAAASASLASLAALPSKPAGPILNNVTRYAVKASARPDTRPDNFARIVQRAERSKPEPIQVASTASVAPRTVKPDLPSKASVA
ncbi:MAG: hypothetical protein GQ539_05325, partial [Sulfitobacter sp.]|nr:hypothetical protein [Sulfitobacter sp.]